MNVQLDLIFSKSKYTTTIIIQISQLINFLLQCECSTQLQIDLLHDL